VNGTLAEEFRSLHFYVNVRAQNNEVLLPAIRASVHGEATWFMLFGPRSAGKSTRVDAAVNQLREEEVFVVLRVSLQRVCLTTEEQFWSTLCRDLRDANPGIETPEFASAAQFKSHVTTASNAFDKPVVLFLDEFDLLYSAPVGVRESVLKDFRGIKELVGGTRLRAVVAIGAFGILELVAKSGSPFNVSPMQVPCFTEAQVGALFSEYQKARGVELDDRIIADIFEQTRGHAGTVAFMGRFIDDVVYPRERPKIGYDAWARAGPRLERDLTDSPNLKRLINELRSPEEAATDEERARSTRVRSARKLLVTILHSSEPFLVEGPDDGPLARYLAAEGALVPVQTDAGRAFAVHSAAVRAILCSRVLPLEQRRFPVGSVPCVRGKLDVALMLRSALPFFDYRVCIDRRLRKVSAAPGVSGSYAAQEDVFQTEFLAVLKAWFPSDLQILSQPPLVAAADRVNSGRGRPKHSDMLIPAIAEQHAVLFELAAQVNEASVKEHILRARTDAVSLAAAEAWMVHFTTGNFVHWPEALLEAGQVPVHVMHVQYDAEWTNLSVRVDGAAPIEINVR
jgi:hypothetical protein